MECACTSQRDTVSDASDGDEIIGEEAEEDGEEGEEDQDEAEGEGDGVNDDGVDETLQLFDDGLSLGREKSGRITSIPQQSLGTGRAATDDVGGVTDEQNRNTLLFDSRFEGGNLGRAVQVHEYEYDMYLMPDTNTMASKGGGNTQWYYFAGGIQRLRAHP